MKPITAFSFLATLDALLVLLIYVLVSVACIRFFWRKRRAQFRVLRHGVVPVLGALITGGIAALALLSPGPAPLSYVPFVVGGWLALGVILLIALRGKLNANEFDSAGASSSSGA